jgi:hypothetical protein
MARTPAERDRLVKAFGRRLQDDAAECRRIGYNPSIFLDMIYRDGPVEACRRVIMDDELPSGFSRLWELHALSLTAEYAILHGEWAELFDEAVRRRAERRLIQYGWQEPSTPSQE